MAHTAHFEMSEAWGPPGPAPSQMAGRALLQTSLAAVGALGSKPEVAPCHQKQEKTGCGDLPCAPRTCSSLPPDLLPSDTCTLC